MKWLMRCLWLLAWGVWLWLGVGLHRQLPRDLGPVVARLPMEPSEQVLGFIKGSKLATFRFDAATESSVIRRWDARTGRLEQEIGGPPFDQGPMSFDLSPDNRFLAWGMDLTHRQDWRSAFTGTRRSGFTPSEVNRVMFDLLTGKQTAIPDHAGVEFHPTKPWVAYWLRGDEPVQYVRIVDLETGGTITEWRGERLAGRRLALNPWFVGDDRIALPVRRPRTDVPREQQQRFVEVWVIDGGKRPLAVIPGGPAFGPAMSASASRLAWYSERDGADVIEVADIDRGQVIFIEPIPETKRNWGSAGPALSDDGHAIVSNATSRLFEIDRGQQRWAAAPDEYLYWIHDGRRFEVCEVWRIPYTTRRLGESYAVRDLHDGRFIWRTWKPVLRHRSADEHGEMLIDGDEVHALPLRVNWLLVGLCQAILALPLVLLWIVLWWRRKRTACAAASARRGGLDGEGTA